MTATEHTPETASGHADHPSDWLYIKVALWLGLFTAIEVFTYFESVHKMPEELLIIVLIVLMVVKFVLVGAYFMHLKNDNKILSQVFSFGLFLAIPVYLVMAFAFGFLDDWHWAIKAAMIVVPPIIAFAGLASRKNPVTTGGH